MKLLRLFVLPLLFLVMRPSAHAQANATAYLSLSFSGKQSPDWEYYVEAKKPDGTWAEVPGAVTSAIVPIRFQASVVVGSTYSVRMRARSTIDRSVFTDPSGEASVVIPEPNTGPSALVLKLVVVVQVSAATP